MKKQRAHELIAILSDQQFHSGEDLGSKLGVTRSAIWKQIRELIKTGLEIESITGKGYRINQSIELLDENIIQQQLSSQTKNHINKIIILDEVDSTNHYLLSISKQNFDKNIACFAEKQTQGKGRQGRTWISPFGANIYHSFLCHFEKDPAEIVGLSLAIGIAVTNALKRYGISAGIALKWPNDVLYQGKKLAGILLETIAENHGQCSVVIGVGINTHLTLQQAKKINQPWTCIADITKEKIKRNALAGILLDELVTTIIAFKKNGLSRFVSEWKKLDYLMGKTVVIRHSRHSIQGIMQDITPRGELILLTENNKQQRFLSGEVSLRECFLEPV